MLKIRSKVTYANDVVSLLNLATQDVFRPDQSQKQVSYTIDTASRLSPGTASYICSVTVLGQTFHGESRPDKSRAKRSAALAAVQHLMTIEAPSPSPCTNPPVPSDASIVHDIQNQVDVRSLPQHDTLGACDVGGRFYEPCPVDARRGSDTRRCEGSCA